MSPVRSALLIAVAAFAGLAPAANAATGEPGAERAKAAVDAPSARAAWTARIVYPTAARVSPWREARRVARLRTVAAWNRGPVELLVLGARGEGDDLWLRVRLPGRPNGAAGWIDADFAVLRRTAWRVVVDRERRRVVVLRAGRPVRRWRVVVGMPGTPTPRGLFSVYERVRQPSGSVLGTWALHLTAHSNVLYEFGGGPGRVAMHGRAGALLADPLGSASSHGCIRLPDRAIRWLAPRAHPGTPIEVR